MTPFGYRRHTLGSAEGRKQKFEDWQAKVVGKPEYGDITADEVFIYFAMKRDANYVEQAYEFLIFEGDWTKPALLYVIKHARRVAENRGYDSVNELVLATTGIPAFAE